MAANQQLWQEERSSRRRLVKRAFICISIVAVLASILLMWLSQPLLSRHQVANELSDAANLRVHVEKLSNEFYPRNHLNLQNLDEVAAYIKAEFEKTGGKVSEQVFRVNGSNYRNIILTLGEGNRPRLIVGAHYDAAQSDSRSG